MLLGQVPPKHKIVKAILDITKRHPMIVCCNDDRGDGPLPDFFKGMRMYIGYPYPLKDIKKRKKRPAISCQKMNWYLFGEKEFGQRP